MGILGKFSNNDDKYSQYKRMGEKILLIVKDHTERLDRNFEDIMLKTNTIDIQSLRLSSFLAGFLAAAVENMKLMEMSDFKLILLDRAVADLMTENGYRSYKFKDIFSNIFKNPEHYPQNSLGDMTFMQGGNIISNLLAKGDKENCLFNITIFLDTLESQDGQYTEGESNKSDMENLHNETSHDEGIYLTATNEVEGKNKNEALWAKCMAISKGDEKKAKYSYINQRVEALKKELAIEISKQKHELKLKEQESIDRAKQKELEKVTMEMSNYQKIRRQEYEKLLQPYPEDKSKDINQELASDNLFPRVKNSNTRFILQDRFKKNVSEKMNNQQKFSGK